MTGVPDELPRLPRRDPRGHKGTFGRVVVVGGSISADALMVGAPALAGLGALRAGAGLVRIAAPAEILARILGLCPSATGVPLPGAGSEISDAAAVEAIDAALDGCDSAVVGPGLGLAPAARTWALRAAQRADIPIVVDADAITALSDVPELVRDLGHCILTPHPGEFRRMGAALRISLDPVNPAQRDEAAAALAQRLGVVVVLKGAGTVVSDGQRSWTCPAGHPVLATGGTGDVLAGAIAGVAAHACRAEVLGRLTLYDAARVAVFAHARAGEQWAAAHGSAGMLASELAGELPAALEPLRG